MGRKLVSENLYTVISILFKRLKLNFNAGVLKRLHEHPDFPSFLSIQHILKQEGVNSIALKTSIEGLRNELPKPVLVHVITNTDLFLLVNHVDNDNVHIINEDGGFEVETIEYFAKVWDGNAMIFDSENITPRSISFKERALLLMDKLKKPFILTVILSLFVFFFINGYEVRNIYNYLFIALPSIGLLFSVLLVIEGFDEHNPLIRKFCTSEKSKNVNCSSMLKSKDAYFLGIISWSDIGLVYFSFIFLLNLTLPSSISLTITGILSILTFPYVFYSITYQKFVAKSWCRLCLGVLCTLMVLLVTSLVLFLFNKFIIEWSSSKMISALLLLIAISTVYLALKPLLKNSFELRNIMPNYRSLKHNTEVKQLLFSKQYEITSASEHSMIFGNPVGETCLTLVINPVCEPCINELKILLPIIKRKENTRAEVVFLTDEKVNDPFAFNLAIMLIDKYLSNSDKFMDILSNYSNIYPLGEYRHKLSYELNSNDKAENMLNKQIEWCVSNKLFSTPKIFVNSKQLPNVYSVEEIDFMCN